MLTYMGRICSTAAGRGRRRITRVLTYAALVVAGSAGLVAPAHADTAQYHMLGIVSSMYNLDVVGASTWVGAPIDVWYFNGNDNQQFTYPETDKQVAEIRNLGSQQCITTDGVAGDTLYQMPCGNSAGQLWEAEVFTTWWNPGKTMVTYINPASGLAMEVYGDSYSPGATVDAWYPNGNENQTWVLPACSGYFCA